MIIVNSKDYMIISRLIAKLINCLSLIHICSFCLYYTDECKVIVRVDWYLFNHDLAAQCKPIPILAEANSKMTSPHHLTFSKQALIFKDDNILTQ